MTSDTEDSASTAPESAAEATDLDLAELRELKRSLMLATQVMAAQSSRSTELRAAIEDVNAVTRAMMVAPAPMSRSAYEGAGGRDCGCGPCDCVAEGCCAFTVKMSHVCVIDMQLEPLDSNVAQMEVRMFASIGGIGAVIPDLTGVLSLHKLVNKPGVWTQVHRPIGTVYVCKGQPKTVNIECTGIEVEDTIVEQAANLRDEYGTASAPMTLDCCCSTPPVVSFEIDFTGGGQGGGTIEVKFTAEKACLPDPFQAGGFASPRRPCLAHSRGNPPPPLQHDLSRRSLAKRLLQSVSRRTGPVSPDPAPPRPCDDDRPAVGIPRSTSPNATIGFFHGRVHFE